VTIEIDHIGLTVSDYEKSKAFYAAALAPLRMTLLMEFPESDDRGAGMIGGFGADDKPFFWFSQGERTRPHLHVAFRAETRAQVDAFFKAAIAAGGKDNGGPGVREMYHPNYYGAFVLDPDGHNIEAVCHAPA
jgi:catechol 2,3-dioxygenase-like lactoylglutathione lyase family enzyme